MFDKGNHGKIKNNKIMIWCLELNQYDYEIRHKPGNKNIASYAFFRIRATVDSTEKLQLLHNSLGHPGYTKLYHFLEPGIYHILARKQGVFASPVHFVPS